MLPKKSCTALRKAVSERLPTEEKITQHTQQHISGMEREWAMKRGKQTKTVNKRHTENSVALIGGDLSTPTYMSAHIFDWMNDCCTFVVHVRCVYFFVGSFSWALCRSFESSDACYNYSQQTQQSKGIKKHNRFSSFSVCFVFLFD